MLAKRGATLAILETKWLVELEGDDNSLLTHLFILLADLCLYKDEERVQFLKTYDGLLSDLYCLLTGRSYLKYNEDINYLDLNQSFDFKGPNLTTNEQVERTISISKRLLEIAEADYEIKFGAKDK